MSRESSPPPMSDDSAIGSMASNNVNRGPGIRNTTKSHDQTNSSSQNHIPNHNNNDNVRNGFIHPEELRIASRQMRYNNTTLLSRSIRTNLSCFDDLDIERLNYRSDYLVNFISIGINKSEYALQRPVSILWPDTYDEMIDEIVKLDAHLINTEFKEKPIDWMLSKGLTTIPNCRFCKNQMTLKYERKHVSWRCQQTQACHNLYAPIQRPIFFKGYESVGLIKILFSIYYWSICTQCDLLYSHLKLEPQVLHGIFHSIQNVCRVALEKSYPRFRLCNNPNSDDSQSNAQLKESSELIDLISIRVNNCFVVCAKHPRSNCVRLGLMIPRVSQYSFAELTESWFAHGAKIRVCEHKFLDLSRKRTDISVTLATRSEMVTKNGSFHRESAFGYLICQLSHTFKDFDSSNVSTETLKLILAELEWREIYGTNPYDAFTKIVEHMATYRGSADCYFELRSNGECRALQDVGNREESEYVFAEKYFYATMHPVDANGEVIERYGSREEFDEPPIPVVQFRCHFCPCSFESLYFSMHMVAHVEKNRKENEQADFLKTKHIRCKHCYKRFKKGDIIEHSNLFRSDRHEIKFGCRICCIKFGDRSKYLEHMRRTHFQHEMPYRCPSCKFASSFQRELIIHFQAEHQQEYVILCPFCLRSFTIADPSNLDFKKMDQVSNIIYRHILEHYALSNSFACDSCCLSFLSKEKLSRHKALHHNPLEIFSHDVKVQPFIISRAEEKYCVQALPMELFIPNKRPNMAIDEISQAATSSANLLEGEFEAKKKSKSTRRESRGASQACSSSSTSSDEEDESEDESCCIASFEKGTIHVRNSSNAKRYLDGGEAALSLIKGRPNIELTTEKIIEYASKLKRADCVIPNQSVVLNPSGRPARCVECREFVTVDHYVAAISCKPCKYTTHCPIAATRHKRMKHTTTNI